MIFHSWTCFSVKVHCIFFSFNFWHPTLRRTEKMFEITR
jgi:hypothetical protein